MIKIKSFNCPQCGSQINISSRLVKLIHCDHCSSSLLLESESAHLHEIGQATENKQDLIEINVPLVIRDVSYQPMGFIQFQHDEGYRKEWWLLDEDKQTYWLSQEDEDLFLVKPSLAEPVDLPDWALLQPNTQIEFGCINWQVIERRSLNFYGYNGSLPFELTEGMTLKYCYLTNSDAESLILIYSGQETEVRKGWWLDPLDILANQQLNRRSKGEQ